MLLLAYPPSWRARYGDEVEVLVRDLHQHGRQPVAMAFDLIRGAVTAWCRTRRGSAMSERSRHALITVLWSWVAFAATAAWFGHDLGIYPNRIVGVAATVVAAVPFAIEAARYARANRANRTFALMAVPPVTAAVWLGGVRLLGHGSDSTARMTIAVIWLLLGLAGIAASTQAVARIVTTTEFAERTWRIGAGAAAAVAAAMLVGTGATIVWGLAYRASQGGASRAQGWLAVTAILAVTTGRAVIALAGSRRAAASAEPAVA